jgi:hypothetical protein
MAAFDDKLVKDAFELSSSASLRATAAGRSLRRSETAIKAAMVAGLETATGDHHGSHWHPRPRRRWLLHRHHQDAPAQHQGALPCGRSLENEKAPNLRVMAGNVEIGAERQRISKDNSVHHSVRLDDPSFSTPIYANPVAVDDGYALIWSG